MGAMCAMGTSAGSLSVSQARGAFSTCSTERSTNRSRLTAERISALLAAAKVAALALELVHGDAGELGRGVVLGFVLVHLVDWDGGVHDGGLHGLLLDDGLDVLVHVVVDVLACNNRVG